jgi:ABC-type Fe3+-hydroxamate transport system substrate-binding protein
VHKIEEAKKLVSEIKAVLTAIAKPENEKIALYVIWREPIMVAARDTFIDSMLRHLGYENAAKNWSRYPVLTAEQISSLEPELIFLSSEPFPFRHKHVQEFRSMFPKSKVLIVDGELFSWYGSRMLRTKSLESLLAFQD